MKKTNGLGFESYTIKLSKINFLEAVCLGLIIFGTIAVKVTDYYYVANLNF